MKLSFILRVLCAGFLAVGLAGCAHNMDIKAQGVAFTWTQSAQKRIAIIHPDVHLGELTAGGLVEPRADWTKTAEDGIAANLKKFFAARSTDLVMVDEITDPHEIQLAKLHAPVGRAVIVHGLLGVKLPNKTQAMDWTLGPGATALRDHYGADYALFMYVNDSYTSAGRALLMIGAAAFGVGIQGGQQVAFCSLVDLRTGNILWFNIRSDQGGDLRDDKGAKRFVDGILESLPK